MEPIQHDRSDLALLCLSSDNDAKRTLQTLFSIAIDLPVLPPGSVASSGAIAKVLDLAREDLLGGCINVMQLASPDIHTSPLALEPYFQSLLDECIAHTLPAPVLAILSPAIPVLLKVTIILTINLTLNLTLSLSLPLPVTLPPCSAPVGRARRALTSAPHARGLCSRGGGAAQAASRARGHEVQGLSTRLTLALGSGLGLGLGLSTRLPFSRSHFRYFPPLEK